MKKSSRARKAVIARKENAHWRETAIKQMLYTEPQQKKPNPERTQGAQETLRKGGTGT